MIPHGPRGQPPSKLVVRGLAPMSSCLRVVQVGSQRPQRHINHHEEVSDEELHNQQCDGMISTGVRCIFGPDKSRFDNQDDIN